MKRGISIFLASMGFAFFAHADTPTISVSGNAFFTSDGDRFYIRGIDYQPGGSSDVSDPIADTEGCLRDVEKFADLGINTIRVYTIDNTADHDTCMEALADNGIYLALDVNTPEYSINREDPEPSYNAVYLQNVFATVDKFQGYDNTLLFFSANEVINDEDSTSAAPYVKAVTRDIRNYISRREYRSIPVGYSAADVDSNRYEMAQYMNCGSDDVRSDFFAFNDYSWCDPSTFKKSGWDEKVETYSNYSIPLFLSEYGCNTNTREFNEVASLYSDDMTSVYSGGLVYEYSEEGNNYGLVEIDDDGNVTELDDFETLKEALSNTPAPTGDGNYNADGEASECPPLSDTWDVDSDEALPEFPELAEQYMENGAGEGAGLDGDGSQYASSSDTSDSDATATEDSESDGVRLRVSIFCVTLTFVAAFGF